MSINASQLSKSGARGKDLDAVVREHLQIIDDKLLKADRTWGRNIVQHDLPVTLALPGLDKKDAQRIIYSAILRSLDKRGFETRILLDPDRTTIYIAWMTDLDVEEVEAMNTLIRAKRIQREELEVFIQRGGASAARTTRQGQTEPAPFDDTAMRSRGGMGASASTGARTPSVAKMPATKSPAEAALLSSSS